MKLYDVVVIGGGPAGLTAAIYASRGGLKTLVIEKFATGGQTLFISDVENYPGILHSDGYSFSDTLLKQAKSFGAETVADEIVSLDLLSEPKKLVLKREGEILAARVIVASGAKARKLGVEREDELVGQGVSYCATCDGGFFRNKSVAVVGGGDSALADAVYLARFSDVTLIHRRDEFRAAKILIDRAKSLGVKFVLNAVVKELKGTPLSSVIVEKKDGSREEIAVFGLFVAVGLDPCSDFLERAVETEGGYILTDETMRTSVEGVYAAGDVRKKELRQIVTACADGAIAADSVVKSL